MHLPTRTGCLSWIHTCATDITASSKKLLRPTLLLIPFPSVSPHLSPPPALNSSSLITSINNLEALPPPGCVILCLLKAQNYDVGPLCIGTTFSLTQPNPEGLLFQAPGIFMLTHGCLGFHSLISNLPSLSRYLWSKISLRTLSFLLSTVSFYHFFLFNILCEDEPWRNAVV